MLLVTGATGNIGGELARLLRDDGDDVRALVRRRPAEGLDGIDVVEGDLDAPDTLRDAVRGIRAAFVLPGYEDMPGLFAVLREAGVERVVLLSGGSAGSGDTSNAVSAYMIRSEQAVRASGLAWTILRPSAYMSNVRRWSDKLAAGDVLRLPFADVRTAVVHPYDVAAVAAAALREDGHTGQVHVPTGPEAMRPADQVAVLARVTGRNLRVEAQPDAEAREEMSRTMPAEYVDAFFDFYVTGTLDESQVRSTVLDVTGRRPRTFEEWVTEHADEFR